MQLPKTHPIFLQVFQLISCITSKKTLKKHKSDLLYLVGLLGPQSETVFLISLLHQIDFSETTYQEDSETPSKIRLSLFLQRLEKNQDSVAFLENFEEVIEDLALSRNITKLEGFHLLLACLKLSLKLQILILFSLMFQEQHSPNPEILSLFQEKLRNMLSQPEPLKNILIQPQILEFLQTSPFFESLRIEFKDNFPISPLFSDDLRLEFDVYEDNPKLKKFHNLDFCLKPHELLQEYTGNPLEITNIFPKNIYNEEEILSCIGSFAKTYPFLEDSCQRDINKVFETHLSSLTTKISSEKTLEKKTVNCNLETFLKGFSEFPIKWPMILQKLDRKSLHSIYKDQKSLTNFLKLIQRLRKMYNLPFPASFLFSKWINIHSQIYFLHNLFQIGVPDLISWSELSQKHIISLDFNPALRYQTLNPASLQFWCCLELLELLIEGSETEYYFHIRNLFEIPLAKCPDILIIGLSQIKPKAGMVLLEELFSNLFPLYLLNHSNSIPILEALWRYNEKLMIEAIFCLYRKENSSLNLSRVLDITQEIKDSLIPLANCSNLIFSVSLGILASKREFLHFEHWLTDRLKNVGNSFITILLRYIEENVILPCDMIEKAELIQPHIVNSAPQNTPLSILEKAQMTLESLGIIMENFLGSGFEKLHPKNQKKAKEIFASVCKYFPALSGMNESAFLEIETAANNLFHKVLSKEMKVEEFVDVLQKLKGSSNPSDKEIYACMVRYLFDEFRHHEEYNQDTLNLTGEIFGRLINTKFLDGTALLGMALECVRYSLEKGSSKRIGFAKAALSCFKKRVFDLFEFFQSVFYLDNIKDKIPDLLSDIYEQAQKTNKHLDIKPELLYFLQNQKAYKLGDVSLSSKPQSFQPQSYQAQSFQPQTFQTQNFQPQSFQTQSFQTQSFQTPNFQTKSFQPNPQSYQPNLQSYQPQNFQPQTQNNLKPKSQSFQPDAQFQFPQSQLQINPPTKKLSLKPPPQIPIPENPNLNILDLINKQNSEDIETIDEDTQNQLTFHLNNLCSNNLIEKASELRKILEPRENVQKWLARTLIFKRVIQETLTKNNYLQLLNQMSLKYLNKLILKETYSGIHKLLSLQFQSNDKASSQIKSFLKNLGFWLGHVTLSRNKPILQKSLNLKQLLAEAFTSNRLPIIIPFICKILEGCKQSEVFVPANPWLRSLLLILNEILQREDIKTTLKQEIKLLFNTLNIDTKLLDPGSFTSLSDDLDFIRVNPRLQNKYGANLPFTLKEITVKVIGKAITEILSPVLARTVTIVLITARKLVLKDFALDRNEQQLQKASSLIVQSLASSLALATSRDPLQTSIQNNALKELETLGFNDKELEEIIQTLLQENLDNVCLYIQKKVVEKALFEISQDPEMNGFLVARKEGVYKPEDGFMKALEILPDGLRPDIKGVTQEEMGVYEDFIAEKQIQKTETGAPLKNTEFWQNLPVNFEVFFDDMSENNLNAILLSYKAFLNEGCYTEQMLLQIGVRLIEVYFKGMNPAAKLEFLFKMIQILMNFPNLAKKLPKELKNYLLNIPEKILMDNTRFNEFFLITLFNSQLLTAKKLDKLYGVLLLKKPIINLQNSIIKTLSHLIFATKQLNPDNCLLSCVSLGNLPSPNEMAVKFLENLNKFSSFSVRMNKKAEMQEFLEKKTVFHEKIYGIFQKYLALFFNKTKGNLEIFQLFENVFFRENEETCLKTLAILIRTVTFHANNSITSVRKVGTFEIDHTLIDALTMLLSHMLYISNDNKNRFFEIILEAYESVLIFSYQQESFNQRGFLRILVNLIESIKCSSGNENISYELYFLLLKKMTEITPIKFPGFTIAWIEVLGNHTLVPEVFKKEELRYSYHLLIVEVMKLLKKLMLEEEAIKSQVFRSIYLATLKIMLLLLHDFPEFLSLYAFEFCNEIPENLVQIRNIVLAAFPKDMRLIDPFQLTDVSKTDYFKEMPKIYFKTFETKITEMNFDADITGYISTKNEQILNGIIEKFYSKDGNNTDTLAINSFIIGTPWILYSKQNTSSKQWESRQETEALLILLTRKANIEIREMLFNAMINQIRYPNLITLYFINLILLFFAEKGKAAMQEQIARIIVERLIVEKPHPWGMMFLFIELIRNQNYSFKEIFPENLFNAIIQKIFKSLNI